MNSRERVIGTVKKQQVDRLPVFCSRIDDLPYWLDGFGVDTEAGLRRLFELDCQKNTYANAFRLPPGKTLWGCDDNWEIGYSSGKEFPLASAQTTADVENHAWPDKTMVDFDEVSAQIATLDPLKARIGTLGFQALFCTLCDLFGMENAMMGMYSSPELIEAAVARIEFFLLDAIEKVLGSNAANIDFFWWGDDFSTQRGLMIAPEMWRKYLKPTYLKIFELIRSHGVMVWFHSCGSFAPVMGDLVDGGIDVWETVQAHLPGNEPQTLKDLYGKHLTFYGAVNCQNTLPFGTPDDVRREVRERFNVLGKGGGYIAGPDHSLQGNMPIENVRALYDEAKKCAYAW